MTTVTVKLVLPQRGQRPTDDAEVACQYSCITSLFFCGHSCTVSIKSCSPKAPVYYYMNIKNRFVVFILFNIDNWKGASVEIVLSWIFNISKRSFIIISAMFDLCDIMNTQQYTWLLFHLHNTVGLYFFFFEASKCSSHIWQQAELHFN